jgi:methyl-accepting chemotaxis protein
MSRLKNLRLGVRLSLCFALVLLLQAGVAVLGLHGLREVQARWERQTQVNQDAVRHLAALRRSAQDWVRATGDVVLLTDPAAMQAVMDHIGRLRADYASHEAQLGSLIAQRGGPTRHRELQAKLRERQALASQLLGKVVDLNLARQREEAQGLLRQVAQPTATAWLATLADLNDLKDQQSQAAARALEADGTRARWWMLAGGLGTLALGLGLAWWMTRALVEPDAAEPVPTSVLPQPWASSAALDDPTPESSGSAASAPRPGDNGWAEQEAMAGQLRRMAEILTVMDGIASQARTLAVNAAVETARNGQVGDALGMVANEVRCLAMRSADLAGEVKALIGAGSGLHTPGGPGPGAPQ